MNIEIDTSAYQHFSFDLWLTIIKSNPNFKIKRDQLLKDFFLIDKSFEEVRKEVRYFDLLFNKISEKTGKHIERESAFLIILDALGKNLNEITSEKLSVFFKKVDELFLENMPVLLWEDVEDLLIKITETGKTASILSNTAFIHGSSLRKVLDYLGLSKYFSFMIFSDEVKISKPNHSIFENVFIQTNESALVAKNEILHIGDNEIADYDGAINFGLNAHLIKL